MKKLLAVLLCLGLGGCATAPTSTLPKCDEAYQNQSDNSVLYASCQAKGVQGDYFDAYGYDYKNYQVTIVSDPPGAKIEWNDEYIGETPCTKVVSGWLSLSYSKTLTIVANPVEAGQYQQTKIISQEPIPNKIYFNMSLGPSTPAVDVNVNNGNQQ